MYSGLFIHCLNSNSGARYDVITKFIINLYFWDNFLLYELSNHSWAYKEFLQDGVFYVSPRLSHFVFISLSTFWTTDYFWTYLDNASMRQQYPKRSVVQFLYLLACFNSTWGLIVYGVLAKSCVNFLCTFKEETQNSQTRPHVLMKS